MPLNMVSMAIYVTLEGKIPRTPCAKEISSNLVVGTAKFKYTKATTAIEQSGVNVVNEATSNHSYTARDYQLPDIVTYLQEQTNPVSYTHLTLPTNREV